MGEKASGAEARKADLEAAKKMLKVLDSERMSAATAEVMAAAMACVLVMHGGLAQAVVVAYALVRSTSERLNGLLAFPGFEDLDNWARALVVLALWVVVLPVALLMEPLAVALNAASFGSALAMEHGARFLQSAGRLEDAGKLLASPTGHVAFGALTAVGALWQLWSWAAGSPVWWGLQLVYLPALVAEGFLGLL